MRCPCALAAVLAALLSLSLPSVAAADTFGFAPPAVPTALPRLDEPVPGPFPPAKPCGFGFTRPAGPIAVPSAAPRIETARERVVVVAAPAPAVEAPIWGFSYRDQAFRPTCEDGLCTACEPTCVECVEPCAPHRVVVVRPACATTSYRVVVSRPCVRTCYGSCYRPCGYGCGWPCARPCWSGCGWPCGPVFGIGFGWGGCW